MPAGSITGCYYHLKTATAVSFANAQLACQAVGGGLVQYKSWGQQVMVEVGAQCRLLLFLAAEAAEPFCPQPGLPVTQQWRVLPEGSCQPGPPHVVPALSCCMPLCSTTLAA